MPQQNATLYQAAFKTNGLKGWLAPGQLRSHWGVNRNGVVSSPKAASSELLAPIQLGSIRNFAVEAKIKVTTKPSSTAAGNGLVVRTKGDGRGGILGGMSYTDQPNDTAPLLQWGRDTVGGANPTLSSGYSTYRLVVHNTDYTLFINGQQVVQFKITDALTGQRVGLWTANQGIQVTSFVVSRLQSAVPLPALPPVKAINLRPADVPSPLQSVGGHYYTTEELSQINNVPVSTQMSFGIIGSYRVVYAEVPFPDSGPAIVFSYVNATISPAAAQQQMARDLAADQASSSKLPNYTTGDLSGVGDQARQLSFDGSTASDQSTITEVYFTRGSYDIEIEEYFIRGALSHGEMVNQTLALAKIVDQRAEQAR